MNNEKYRLFDISLLFLIYIMGTYYGVNWNRVFGYNRPKIITISRDDIIEVSKTSQNIDGKPLSKTRQIPYSPESFKFRMVHRIPKKNYREEFSVIFRKKNIVMGLEAKDNSEGKRKFFKNSQIIGTRGENDYRDNEFILLLNLVDFLSINYQNKPEKFIQTVTTFELDCRFDGKNVHRKIEITNIDDKLADNPDDNIFKLKFLMLHLVRIANFNNLFRENQAK